jgi:hypothetical protein
LGQADDEATWQSYDSLKLTEALDNYIVDNISSQPQLFHLVPPKDRTLLRLESVGSHITYVFSYGDHILRVPNSLISRLSDARAIHNAARQLASNIQPSHSSST